MRPCYISRIRGVDITHKGSVSTITISIDSACDDYCIISYISSSSARSRIRTGGKLSYRGDEWIASNVIKHNARRCGPATWKTSTDNVDIVVILNSDCRISNCMWQGYCWVNITVGIVDGCHGIRTWGSWTYHIYFVVYRTVSTIVSTLWKRRSGIPCTSIPNIVVALRSWISTKDMDINVIWTI